MNLNSVQCSKVFVVVVVVVVVAVVVVVVLLPKQFLIKINNSCCSLPSAISRRMQNHCS